MHINVEHHDRFATIHLRGEFDTFYVPALQDEVSSLIKAGVHFAVLNLRLVRFINSTALGAIIKISKQLASESGRLVISRPSPFCRTIIEKVGLDRVVSVYDTDEAAAQAVLEGDSAAPAKAEDGGLPPLDESSVLFTPTDKDRIEHFLSESRRIEDVNPVHGHAFGKNWTAVGRMASLDESGLRFTWGGGDTGLAPFAMGQLLAIGTELKIKFRLPLYQKGYCEAICEISEIEERDEGVKVGAAFTKIEDKIRNAVRQYAKDLAFLKEELKIVKKPTE